MSCNARFKLIAAAATREVKLCQRRRRKREMQMRVNERGTEKSPLEIDDFAAWRCIDRADDSTLKRNRARVRSQGIGSKDPRIDEGGVLACISRHKKAYATDSHEHSSLPRARHNRIRLLLRRVRSSARAKAASAARSSDARTCACACTERKCDSSRARN